LNCGVMAARSNHIPLMLIMELEESIRRRKEYESGIICRCNM
jgi:hypothetical protein